MEKIDHIIGERERIVRESECLYVEERLEAAKEAPDRMTLYAISQERAAMETELEEIYEE